MKMSSEHLEAMRGLISPLDTEANREKYRSGNFSRSELTKDVDRRYRWDLFWASKANRVVHTEDCDYNDSHINTALKSIVPSLGVKS